MEKNNKISKIFYEYLKAYHKGQRNAASSKKLEAVFNLNGKNIRIIINNLRCEGIPICSDKNGYYYAETLSELSATIAQLNSRIKKMSVAKNGLSNHNDLIQED